MQGSQICSRLPLPLLYTPTLDTTWKNQMYPPTFQGLGAAPQKNGALVSYGSGGLVTEVINRAEVPAKWILQCAINFSPTLKLFPHKSQTHSRMSECETKCVLRCDLVLKTFPHTGQMLPNCFGSGSKRPTLT
jgi:hypothetical protein